MALSFPISLRFSLTRRQRLAAIVAEWDWWTPLVVMPLEAFFLVQTAHSLWTWSLAGVAVFGGLALGMIVVFGGLIGGLVNVLICKDRWVDIELQADAAGILLGKERWYLFLDGITSIRQSPRDLWTIRHHNGFVLWIPVTAITGEQIEHLRAAMVRGHTPEGVRAVIERGKRIEAILAERPD
jgi:hypothetical protein